MSASYFLLLKVETPRRNVPQCSHACFYSVYVRGHEVSLGTMRRWHPSMTITFLEGLKTSSKGCICSGNPEFKKISINNGVYSWIGYTIERMTQDDIKLGCSLVEQGSHPQLPSLFSSKHGNFNCLLAHKRKMKEMVL